MSRMATIVGMALMTAVTASAAYAQQAPDRAGQAMERFRDGPMRERMMERQDRGSLSSGALLRAADIDQDGVATRAEIDALQAEEFAWRDRNGDGALDDGDQGPTARRLAELRGEPDNDPWAAPRARDLDADGDRRVTLAETAARTDALFERLDEDGDGAITADEARAARPGRPGGPGGRQ